MNDRLEIHTLGNLTIYRGGIPVKGLASRKAEAALVYLAANPRPHPREVLAEMLWDERSQSQSLSNLRVVLSSLRKELGDFVEITPETAVLKPEAETWLDARDLEAKLDPHYQRSVVLHTVRGRAVYPIPLYHPESQFQEASIPAVPLPG